MRLAPRAQDLGIVVSIDRHMAALGGGAHTFGLGSGHTYGVGRRLLRNDRRARDETEQDQLQNEHDVGETPVANAKGKSKGQRDPEE